MSAGQRVGLRRIGSSMRRRGGLLIAALIGAALVYAIVESSGFTAEARRAPLVVAIPAAVAVLALLARELRSPTEPDEAEPPQPAVEQPQPPAQEPQRPAGAPQPQPVAERPRPTGASTAAAIGWVLVLTAMFLLFGLLVAAPLFVAIFTRVYGREQWRTVILTTAAVSGLVYVFFVQVLSIQVFGGWLRLWFLV